MFRTQSNLVLVDVVVRDHGKPVEGLKQTDFHVLEDGKLQPVTIFEEHKASDAQQVATAPVLPSHFTSDDPQYVLTSAANVVLLDALNTPLADQLYVRHRMLAFLKTIPPGTRVAVFTLASKLRMVQGFDTGPGALETALKAKQANPQVSPIIDPAFDQAMQTMTDIAQGAGASGSALQSMQQFQGDQQLFQMDLRIEITVNAMDELGRYLSTIPGRKNLVWFSGAFPPIVMGSGGQMGQSMAQSDYNEEVKKMNALLALARVSVYPVDVRGLMGTNNDLAEANPANPQLLNSVRSTPGGAGIGGQQTVSQRVEAQNAAFLVQNQAEHDLMKTVAKETGGEAFVNTNGVGEALGAAIANGSSYYTLGYAPDNRNYDGSFRTIEVQLPGSRADLAYRRGYYAISEAKQLQLMQGRMSPLIAAMQRGAPGLSQVLFKVRVLPGGDATVKGEATAGPAGAMAGSLQHPQRYVVDYWIGPKGLEMTKLPDGRTQVKVELTQVDFDREGIRLNYTDGAMEVDLTAANAARGMQDGVRLRQEIDVPEGESFLRIGVADMMSGRIGTVEIGVGTGNR
ncbi:MAG TPA: VWA domain-containing protein [Acidobacteriaceae bacterium]|nr:VWA domain-containing protein [Acidobacteriaceae bacterium]